MKALDQAVFIFIGTLDAFGFQGFGYASSIDVRIIKRAFQRVLLQLVLVFK
jgi:hypothetical protein